MIDTSTAKWNFSKEEKYAIQWLNDNGFSRRVAKQLLSKTIFEVSKDGVTDQFVLNEGVNSKQMPSCMKQFEKNWETLCELQKLRQQAKILKS